MNISDQQHLLDEDTQSRIRALRVDESFIVEAPAGAGKTELLTQRYLGLLETVNEPEEIIAITFTNKAASEMRARILDSLQDAADDAPIDKPHKQQTRDLALKALKRGAARSWRLLENPSRLRIYTIDSFSSHLARQMPLMSRFGAQPGVREDASPYYEEAATRTLELLETDGVGEVVQQALRYFDNDAYRLNQLLADMLSKRDQWLDYIQHNPTPEIAEQALGRMILQDIHAAAAILTPALQQQLMPLARYAGANLPCEESISLLRDWDTPIPAKPEALPMWRTVCDLLLTSGDTLRKTVNVKQGFPAGNEGKALKDQMLEFLQGLEQAAGAEAVLAGIRRLPEVKHGDEAWQIIATLGQLLNLAVAQLWLVFQSRGEVDFVEIAQRALKALEDDAGNPTELALKLDYRIQHLLVDEFQDTSPTQVKLLQRLTLGWQPGDGRTLFAVGDPMQSIYRFRKANVGLFLRVAEEGVGDLGLTKLRLWRNNRSCAPVIDWINQSFEKVFPQQDSVTHGAISYRAFAATKADEANAAVHVHPLISTQQSNDNQESTEQDDSDEEASFLGEVEDIRQREADKIIAIIQQTREANPKAKIAVLVRARSHLHALVSRIRRHHPDLNFQAVEIEELANRQIVQDLLSLTNALHHRADRVHWLAILRAPWCGLSLADLHTLAGGDRNRTIYSLMHDDTRLNAMSEDGRARLMHVRHVLDEALAQRGRQSAARWVHGVWLMLGGADCLWEPGDVRDVQAFFDRIASLEAGGQFSTEQLAIEVKKLYAAPDAEADDSLQFMTIHKSKGLEFDTVILPGLDRKTGNNDQPLLLWEEVPRLDENEHSVHDAAQFDLIAAPLAQKGKSKSEAPMPYDYLKHLERTRAANEDARVLYVAATRAERCLHLIGVAKLNNKGQLNAPKNTFMELLWPHVYADFAAASESVSDTDLSNTEAKIQNTNSLADFVPKLVRLAAPKLPEVFSDRADVISQVTRTTKAENEIFTATEINSLDSSIGILAHRYLELVMKQGVAAWPVKRIATLKPAMLSWLQKQGIKADQLESSANRTTVMLQTTLQSEDGQWLLKPRDSASAELPISSLDELEARTQRLDLTFVEDGVRWIVDYKSTQLPTDISEEALQLLAETHREQLEGYAKLFVEEGLPVKTAIFFLSVGQLVIPDIKIKN